MKYLVWFTVSFDFHFMSTMVYQFRTHLRATKANSSILLHKISSDSCGNVEFLQHTKHTHERTFFLIYRRLFFVVRIYTYYVRHKIDLSDGPWNTRAICWHSTHNTFLTHSHYTFFFFSHAYRSYLHTFKSYTWTLNNVFMYIIRLVFGWLFVIEVISTKGHSISRWELKELMCCARHSGAG